MTSKVGQVYSEVSRRALLSDRIFRAGRIAGIPGAVIYLGTPPRPGAGAEYLVRSESDPRTFYHVTLYEPWAERPFECTCPDWQKRGSRELPCKHILAVEVTEGRVTCVRCLRWAAPRTGEILCDECKRAMEAEAALIAANERPDYFAERVGF